MEPCGRFGILLSGKRKSGKDFIAHRLTEMIQKRLNSENAAVQLRIAQSLKRRFAEIHGIDSDELMTTSDYKDRYRAKMIEWSENERKSTGDFFQFCREACESVLAAEKAESKVWIVVDCRRRFEVEYFLLEGNEGRKLGNLTEGVITVRVTASEETRKSRGWMFIKGADDIDSECGLDDYPSWDFIIDNDKVSNDRLEQQLVTIVERACQSFGNCDKIQDSNKHT